MSPNPLKNIPMRARVDIFCINVTRKPADVAKFAVVCTKIRSKYARIGDYKFKRLKSTNLAEFIHPPKLKFYRPHRFYVPTFLKTTAQILSQI